MARINVEQKALTDPRFYRLGIDMGAEKEHAQAVGLFAMIRVWNECIESGKHILDGWVIQAVLGRNDAVDLVVNSDLGKTLSDNRVRLRGTKGRIEYLELMRKNGRENGPKGAQFGKLGGRPKVTPSKPPYGVSENPIEGFVENPPPAPAPALTLNTSEKTNTLSIPPPAPLVVLTGGNGGNPDRAKPRKKTEPDPVTLKRFQKFWNDFYPKRVCKQAALKAFLKLNPDPETLTAMVADISKRIASGEWLPDDEERRKFIPNCSTYLNQRRWEDEQ